jgi:Zn-dependent protease
VDRARVVGAERYNYLVDPADPVEGRDYEPIHPRGGTDWRRMLGRLAAPFVFLIGLLAKLSVLAKFGLVFVAVGGYALIWGWTFAIGVVVLIFLHEMGHYLEATREHLHPELPVFIPFLGAYVRYTRGNPWQTARVALAGPIFGGIAALACYAAGEANNSQQLVALAYFGFLLNLINLLPFGILDGGAAYRSIRYLWHGGGRDKAIVAGALYVTTAVFLAVGMIAAHIPQHRL